MSRNRADWQRPLPRPLIIPGVMTLRTLADVRALFRLLPAERRARDTWQAVARTVAEAAIGVVGAEEVDAALWLIFQLERGECRPA
jgi:hypothetical protein